MALSSLDTRLASRTFVAPKKVDIFLVTSGQYVTGEGNFDQKEFVWTLHKSKEEWEMSS